MKNAFTGEPQMKTETMFQQKRREGLSQKALDDAELIPYGERGETRPKSRGRIYDIPPANDTYCEDMVDQTGGDAVDLNKLMARVDPSGKAFNKAVQSGAVTETGQFYDDFTTAPTFQEALNTVIHSRQQFVPLRS